MSITTINTADSLSPRAVMSLAEAVELVLEAKPIKWSEDGTIREGTARYFIKDEENWYGPNWEATDVRDAWVRITMRSGFERAMPFAQLLGLYRDNMLVVND